MSLGGGGGREGTFVRQRNLIQTAPVPEHVLVRFDRACANLRARRRAAIHADRCIAIVIVLKVSISMLQWAQNRARSTRAAAGQSLECIAACCPMPARCVPRDGGEVGAGKLSPRSLVARPPWVESPLNASEGCAASGGRRATLPQQPLRPPRRPPPAAGAVRNREDTVGVEHRMSMLLEPTHAGVHAARLASLPCSARGDHLVEDVAPAPVASPSAFGISPSVAIWGLVHACIRRLGCPSSRRGSGEMTARSGELGHGCGHRPDHVGDAALPEGQLGA